MAWQPSTISSWISWVPEALSSISTALASNRFCCSRTARFSAGYSSPRRNTPSRKRFLPFDPPGRAHAEIAELGRLVGGVPALDDVVEALRPFVLAIALEPLHLHEAAAQWGGGLLILAGEIVFPDGAADPLEGVGGLPPGGERLSLPRPKAKRAPDALRP